MQYKDITINTVITICYKTYNNVKTVTIIESEITNLNDK